MTSYSRFLFQISLCFIEIVLQKKMNIFVSISLLLLKYFILSNEINKHNKLFHSIDLEQQINNFASFKIQNPKKLV